MLDAGTQSALAWSIFEQKAMKNCLFPLQKPNSQRHQPEFGLQQVLRPGSISLDLTRQAYGEPSY